MEDRQMDYEQFETTVKEHFQGKYGPGTRVDVRSIWKNNGVWIRGMSVVTEGVCVSPTLYLEPFYDSYREGMPLRELLLQMEKMNLDMRLEGDVGIDFFTDYEKAKETLCIKLINFEKNKEQLEQMPYVPFLDFAIVFYSHVENHFLKNGSILIFNKHLKGWQITKEELYVQAMENSQKKSPQMCLELSEIFGSIGEVLGREVSGEELPMYVLTNRRMCDGAAVLCYPGVLQKCAQQIQSDFYIIPSSIHEVLLISCENSTQEELHRMVSEVNAKEVSEEDILSDHVYRYSLERKTLTNLITGQEQRI